jgi:hypothetical protein
MTEPARCHAGRDEARLAAIREQRDAVPSWPDFHPEDFCHRCGHPNLSWYVDSTLWGEAWDRVEPGIQSVLCPQCFAELWELATGLRVTWELRPSVATLRTAVARQVAEDSQ